MPPAPGMFCTTTEGCPGRRSPINFAVNRPYLSKPPPAEDPITMLTTFGNSSATARAMDSGTNATAAHSEIMAILNDRRHIITTPPLLPAAGPEKPGLRNGQVLVVFRGNERRSAARNALRN